MTRKEIFEILDNVKPLSYEQAADEIGIEGPNKGYQAKRILDSYLTDLGDDIIGKKHPLISQDLYKNWSQIADHVTYFLDWWEIKFGKKSIDRNNSTIYLDTSEKQLFAFGTDTLPDTVQMQIWGKVK